ncbi:restriction endonuclease subunit S [Leuconostoc mesenteroides]|uniref:restriction endonuclease subunit S n=3 Tax=Leuconostoc mesenteroides TaxID=1245 RepID=UPI001CBB617A|nr:restriction endonuclease subunit S [Leuconostoc mesenteroides]MBZ1515031.1 restriction endonuclease subunit S [Leuconostoc mesenteroides]
MSKKTPQIRFKGFTDDWEERKLGDISYKVKEKNKTGEFTETLTNSAEYGIINQRDFFDKDISNAKNLTGYYVVKNDDFVYNPRISNFAPVGPIKRNKLGRTGVMSPLYYVFRTHDIDKNYFEKYFDTVYWHRFMELNGDSGARADRFAIKDSVFVEMPIPYPTMDEQQKIGLFFKQLDDTIALHQRKLDLLKEQKKGYLQKMFPKNGAKVPELRFAGFADDWEERKVKDIFKITRGQVLAATETSEEKSDISPFPVYSSQTKNNGLMGYYKDYLFDTAITWTTDGANAGTVSYRSGRFYSTNVNGVLISDKGYTNKAISEILNLEAWKWVSHVGNPKLMNNVMGDISIMIPRSFEEHDRLSDFLNQLDDTIALHQRKLDLLKEQKKGFLQKMFVS